MATLNRDQQIEEIINLEAILNLPKGTEHFVSDLHGEFEAFDHILRNGSGRIREKVQFLFKQELNAHQMDEQQFVCQKIFLSLVLMILVSQNMFHQH